MTDQPQSRWQKLKQFSKQGYGSDAKGLTANRNRALTGLVLALGAFALMAPDLLAGTAEGLPRNDRLVPVRGLLTDGQDTSHGIDLTLDGQPSYFTYPSKAEGQEQVWKSLCKSCAMTLWVDPDDHREHRVVFQIAVNGAIVRSYADVRKEWIANNSIALWIGGFFALAALFLGWLTAREQIRLSRLRKP